MKTRSLCSPLRLLRALIPGCLLAAGCQTPESTAVPPVHGPTNPLPGKADTDGIQRFGSVIGLNAEKVRHYRELHAVVWPGVLAAISKANIRNYNIFFLELEGQKYLFSYFEYVGNDFAGDMKRIGEDETTRRWWKETDPCQFKLPGTPEGEQWLGIERIFYYSGQKQEK